MRSRVLGKGVASKRGSRRSHIRIASVTFCRWVGRCRDAAGFRTKPLRWQSFKIAGTAFINPVTISWTCVRNVCNLCREPLCTARYRVSRARSKRRMDAAYWRQWMEAVDDAILAGGSSSTPFVLVWPSRTIHAPSAQLNFILLSPVAVCPLVCSSIGYMLSACIPCWCVCNAVCRYGSAVILFHIGVPVAASPSMVFLFVLYFFTSSLRRATLSDELCCSYIDLCVHI